MPLVSIIIPVYKTEEYLPGCMETVLGQTYENLEIILVDDGSPDGCPAMCDEYAKKDSRVKVIHRENGGLSAARNSGIDAARGDYLTFLDSDDRIAPETVETMVALAGEADIVKITLVRKKPGEEWGSVPGAAVTISGREALNRIYTDPPQIISACGKLFRRALFRELRFPEGLYYEDEFTTPKLYHRAQTVVLSESVLYFYMQWEGESIMRSGLTEKKIRDSLHVTGERLDFFRQQGLSGLAKKAVADHWLKLKNLEAAAQKQPELAAVLADIRQQKKEFQREHWASLAPVRLKQWLYRKVKG